MAEDASYLACGVFHHNSSTEPNLQNLPQRKARAKIIKRQFICEALNVILKRDFSAHEIRTWGISARDAAIAKTFWTGMRVRLLHQAQRVIGANAAAEWKRRLDAADVHRQNYGMLYGVDPASVIKSQRDGVKTTIFGSLYGYGMATLGRVLTKALPKRLQEIDAELRDVDEKISRLEGAR